MNKNLTMAMTAALMMSGSVAQAQDVNIGRSNITLTSDLMTPETLWAMGRIGAAQASPDGKKIVYQVGYYSVKENKGHQVLRVMDADGKNDRLLTTSAKSEGDAAWLDNNTLAFLTGGQLWTMNADGTNRKQLTHSDIDIEGFRFSPDRKRVVLIKSIPYYGTIKQNPSDLPKATGMVITDMNYRHWDHYVTTNAHPFVADVTPEGIGAGIDVLEGEPYESPLAPFGGIEQIDWSKDSKFIAYTCRKKEGTQYAISTDADIYIYNVETRQTKNLCKPADYVEPKIDATKSMRNQAVNSQANEIFAITPAKKEKASVQTQLSFENKHIYDQLALGDVKSRWVKTTDGKEMMEWVITPPHFDPNKKYPTLLFCEGGPQSPVSQFWSYRWNFQIMAANGYVIIAPNRRGLPGFGSAWNEEVSTDWTGQCMNDYLSAIDDAANNLPFVDKDRLGAVGASFGGFSVYYLAGIHNKRFKCFISHDGAFNLESMYTDTEEAWFSNWEYDDAYWNKDKSEAAKRTYANSPHLNVDKWDTPILCIHGEKDYRINANQGMGAFNAARLRGIPAELLLYPDENHWVLKPQNSVLWQRTFFNWLDRWLKK